MILVMPLRAFGQLNLHRKKRCKWRDTLDPNTDSSQRVVALMGVFLVGGIAVIASIVRLYALWVYTTTVDVAYDAIFVRHSQIRKGGSTLTGIDPPTIAD